ncbi:hypothetical protein [Streptomyces sp. NPDC048442]|uniref:WDGH domain-containing protein n=1 Tax=Streptomyces sp. NPDC048442 TaxID=3154823 RepID=UPI003431C18D
MTEPTTEQLLHLVDRAVDGRLLPEEAALLRAEIGQLHADIDNRDEQIRHLDAGLARERARVEQSARRLLPAAQLAADERDRAYAAEQRAEQTEAERDGVYRERARLVAHLASLYPAHIGHTDPTAPGWAVVIIEAPTGQMSWHIAERDLPLFAHVEPTSRICRGWDGHTTEEKYERLAKLVRGEGHTLFRAEHAEAAVARVRALLDTHLGPLASSAVRHALGQPSPAGAEDPNSPIKEQT